jgi:glycosyltransferase involved in cell wall biosynthesis
VQAKNVPVEKAKTLLVIPVFNHGATLVSVMAKALESGWRVLIVDDGSSDHGPEQASGPGLLVHTLPKNQGKGAAILAGARIAREMGYEAIVTLDADGQHNPAEADILLTATEKDWPAIVIGNRRMEGKFVPKASRFGRVFSNFWVRIETGMELPDTQSGMRLYPVHELLQIPLKTRRFDFEIEALVRLIWAGVPVLSVSVSVHYPKPDERVSHFNMVTDNIRLSILHTFLVLRALLPWPHKRLIPRTKKKRDLSFLFHPLQFLSKILNQHATPQQIACAAWVGVFMGALPLIGFHTVAIIYVTHRLNLNKVAAVAASSICTPPFVPLLCIQTGFFLQKGHFLTSFTKETLLIQAGDRIWEYFLGSFVVGPLLGLFVAMGTYLISRGLQKKPIVLCL